MSADFQRFQSVRARQRAERRRWLSVLSALAATALIAAIQVAGPMMPGGAEIARLLSRGASLVGETRGRVEMVERDTRTIRIKSGFLGLTSVALVVTEDT